MAESNFGEVGISPFKMLSSKGILVFKPPQFSDRWTTTRRPARPRIADQLAHRSPAVEQEVGFGQHTGQGVMAGASVFAGVVPFKRTDPDGRNFHRHRFRGAADTLQRLIATVIQSETS